MLRAHHPGVTRRKASSWYLVALGLIAVGVVALAISEIGPAASSTRTSTQLVTAANGVIQSTVTGSGNIEPGTDDQVNFATSGTLQHVYVKVGEHVQKGQLLATLDPSTAQLTLDQADKSLDAAKLQLTAAEQGASGSGASAPNGTPAATTVQSTTQFVALEPTTTTTPSAATCCWSPRRPRWAVCAARPPPPVRCRSRTPTLSRTGSRRPMSRAPLRW